MKKFFKKVYKLIYKFFYNIVRFIVLVFRQMKKVRWPDKKILQEASLIVISFIVFLGLYFTVANYIIIKLLGLINY